MTRFFLSGRATVCAPNNVMQNDRARKPEALVGLRQNDEVEDVQRKARLMAEVERFCNLKWTHIIDEAPASAEFPIAACNGCCQDQECCKGKGGK